MHDEPKVELRCETESRATVRNCALTQSWVDGEEDEDQEEEEEGNGEEEEEEGDGEDEEEEGEGDGEEEEEDDDEKDRDGRRRRRRRRRERNIGYGRRSRRKKMAMGKEERRRRKMKTAMGRRRRRRTRKKIAMGGGRGGGGGGGEGRERSGMVGGGGGEGRERSGGRPGANAEREPFREDPTFRGNFCVWSWVSAGQKLKETTRGGRRLKCKLCGREFSGGQPRAAEHFIWKRPTSRCPHGTLAIWRRLHAVGVALPTDLLESVRAAEEEENSTGDGGLEGGDAGADVGDEGGRQAERGGKPGPQSCSGVEDVGGRAVDVRGAFRGEACPSRANALQARVCNRGQMKQASIARWVKNPRQKDIDESCIEFFVENSIPFNVAKSKSFKKFVNTCYGPQPAAKHSLVLTGYNPLRCYLLDGLRQRLNEEEKAINDDWEVTGCTFITDGTTDICGRSLVNYILAGRSKPLFVKCEDVSEQNKGAGAVVRGWKNFFREIGVEKITAICTDSFSGNKSAATMLRADPEFQQIYWIPCIAHCMDLFMQDVGDKPWAKDIIKKANMVVKFFRNHRWPRSMLRTELMAQKGVKIRVLLRPALTRFGTHFVMLDRLLTCERALRRLVLGDSWTKMDWQPYIWTDAYEVESLITDRAFWADLKKLHQVMKGSYDVLRMVDKDIHCLSRVYDAAVDLKNCVLHAPLTDDERDSILRDVGKRTDMLLSPVHAVARLLDPRLRDITVFSNLDLMAQFDSVVDRLVAKNGSQKFTNYKDQLYDFQFGRGIFGDAAALRRAEKDNAVLWWEAHGGGHPELKMLAMRMLSIWTTSSPAERNWSTWSLVQTKTRNQLKHKRTEKLVYSH
ncbi:hypothetical protein CBR_g37090 [Chara braunii]|uniref:DUF659 domain-containing protein n=1 Tax=Chara braunii TaxID=69332 RepID=A0A388LM21_CHABU|nr:hypothetical protein CBR_g37090 [Chara braunii]|eukprot:GBG83376.1 hypothetical protein CBR_g37090 [Chara braunii]